MKIELTDINQETQNMKVKTTRTEFICVFTIWCLGLTSGELSSDWTSGKFGEILQNNGDSLLYGSSLQICVDESTTCSTNFDYVPIRKIGLASCLQECNARAHCSYITYHFRANLCYLIYSNEDIANSIVFTPGFILGNKLFWNVTEINTCANCSDLEVCTGEPLRCRLESCGSPGIDLYQPYSYTVGNLHKIGNRVTFQCEDSHILVINTTNVVECLPNGTWTRPNYSCYDIDECLSTPCQNGGQCNNLVGMYTCTCAQGYTGVQCEAEIDECLSSPCLNDGVCNDVLAGYSCTCAQGYNGTNCETAETGSVPCTSGSCDKKVKHSRKK